MTWLQRWIPRKFGVMTNLDAKAGSKKNLDEGLK
jgi:hypothetical protein